MYTYFDKNRKLSFTENEISSGFQSIIFFISFLKINYISQHLIYRLFHLIEHISRNIYILCISSFWSDEREDKFLFELMQLMNIFAIGIMLIFIQFNAGIIETGTFRCHGRLIKGIPDPPQTSRQYGNEVF